MCVRVCLFFGICVGLDGGPARRAVTTARRGGGVGGAGGERAFLCCLMINNAFCPFMKSGPRCVDEVFCR